MNKAYDLVEWSFLRAMMARLGFHEEWINLIMNCVSMVSYKVKINGNLSVVSSKSEAYVRGIPSPLFVLVCSCYVRKDSVHF
jgi:hypothetical protein